MAENLNTRAEAGKGKASNQSRPHPGRTAIHRVLTAAEIGILVGVIVLFNVFPEKVGFYSSAVEPYLFVPLLTPAWLPYLPWLNVWWGLALSLALVKLVYGRWTQVLRWADLGVHLLSIMVIASLLVGGGIAGAGSDNAVSIWGRQHPDLIAAGFKAVLGLVLVVLAVGFFSKLAKLGMAIPVLQWRFDGAGPRFRWIKLFSPGALRLGAAQGEELLKDARPPDDA
jgi:hypothetical protein